jgi:hypothetical protein
MQLKDSFGGTPTDAVGTGGTIHELPALRATALPKTRYEGPFQPCVLVQGRVKLKQSI